MIDKPPEHMRWLLLHGAFDFCNQGFVDSDTNFHSSDGDFLLFVFMKGETKHGSC